MIVSRTINAVARRDQKDEWIVWSVLPTMVRPNDLIQRYPTRIIPLTSFDKPTPAYKRAGLPNPHRSQRKSRTQQKG